MDPIKLLTKQHREVEALFARHEGAAGNRRELFEEIEENILAHSLIEEAQVYPLMRERIPDGEELVEHAQEEHKKVETMLKRLSEMSPESEEYDSMMAELIQSVRHHVREEEESDGMFDKLREAISREEMAKLGSIVTKEAGEEPTREGEAGRGRGQGGSQRRGARSQRSASRSKNRSSRTGTGTRGRATARGGRKSSTGSSTRRRSGAKRPAAKRQTQGRTKARRR